MMNEADLPSAFSLLPAIARAWDDTETIAVLLDFDGTLARIVEHPDDAGIPDDLRGTLQRLAASVDGLVAVVSGRGLSDVQRRVGVASVVYAGNHGMEIEGGDISRTHASAVAARPQLEQVLRTLGPRVAAVGGALLEDKGLTLTVHYRRVARDLVPALRRAVLDAVADEDALRVTEGKEILEIRPRVEWDKGKAVEFLLDRAGMPDGAPVIYIGDDITDEDAFAVLGRRGRTGFGVIVGSPPFRETAASGYLETTEEVARMLDLLVRVAPSARG